MFNLLKVESFKCRHLEFGERHFIIIPYFLPASLCMKVVFLGRIMKAKISFFCKLPENILYGVPSCIMMFHILRQCITSVM